MKITPRCDIAQAILTEEGEWVSKSEWSAVDSEGNPVEIVPSSFDGTIELKDTVTLEEYLDHVIKNVYTFTGDDEKEMVKLLENGTIYTFLFNYRKVYSHRPAYSSKTCLSNLTFYPAGCFSIAKKFLITDSD
jgi:hypothetical protein